MGYIYKVICTKTNKIYIGKTESTVNSRWKEHCRAAFLPSHGDYNFPFHRAIRKYGIENFIIETIDSCKDSEELKEKEKYWIQYYDSYNNGYNASLGGDGHCKYNYDQIVNYYLQHNCSLIDTCKYFQVYDQVVYAALNSKNIDYKKLSYQSNNNRKKYNKPILLEEEQILFFKMTDIDKYLNKNAHGNIRRCLQGVTEKAYGFHWREIEEDEDVSKYMAYK